MSAAAWIAGATLLAGLLPPTPSPQPVGVHVGQSAPPLSITALDGRTIGSLVLRGRPTFVNVFATSCAPCHAEIAILTAAYKRHRARVTFVGVVEGEPAAKVASFARRMHISYMVGIDDGAMAATFGAGSIPHSVFIDAHGIVRAMQSGAMSRAQFERDLALIGAD